MEDYKDVCQDHLTQPEPPTRPARSLSRPARHSSCVAVKWSLTQREIRLAQRAGSSGWLSFENQRKGVSSFVVENAEKLESFGQGHLVDEITANYSIYSCEFIKSVCSRWL